MKEHVDIMLDLETLGSGPSATIIQVGACYFDRYTGEIGETFDRRINPETSEKYQFRIDASTVMWWLSQSKDSQNCVLIDKKEKNDPRFDVLEVLKDFNLFLKPKVAIWSHATFDFVLLPYHYRRTGIPPNFQYWQARDIRTIVDLAGINVFTYKQKNGVAHSALNDCLHQVRYCVDAFNKLTK